MKKLVISLALATMVVAVSAQPKNGYNDEALGTYERVTKSGPYLTNGFWDNWFFGAAVGANVYVGTGWQDGPGIGDRIAFPAIDVNLGKWITPSVGLRLQGNYGKAINFNYMATDPYVIESTAKDGFYKGEFNVIGVHADFLWNLSNAIGGYKESRFWSFVPFVGFGYAQSKATDDAAAAYEDFTQRNFGVSAGLLNIIRLGQVVDLTLEVRGLLVKNNFDGVVGYTFAEGMGTVTAGVNFKFGPKGGFKRPVYVPAANYTPYENRISALESELAEAKAANDRLRNQINALQNQKPTTSVEKVFTPVTINSFFEIGKTNVSEKDKANLKNIADVMKANPDRKFSVKGYADAGTGSAKRNQELSNQRAQNVADVLVKEFGVKASQLEVKGMGGVSINKNPALDRSVVIE